MNLRDYIKTFKTAKERALEIRRLAKKLKISHQYVYSMYCGQRRILEKYAVPLEKASNGKIPRETTCPKLYR